METSKSNLAVPVNSSVLKTLKIPRTFEIMIEEMHEDDSGRIMWRPVIIDPKLGGNRSVTITVNSPDELRDKQQWYERAGQRFKIIREINPPSESDIKKIASEQGVNLTLQQGYENTKPAPAQARPVVQSNGVSDVRKPHAPKIITVGDIQIKYDGDSVYQKQWIQLSPKEAANIRIISDANNKVIPMKGRHVEVKRWVKVEGSSVLDENSEDV